MATYWTLATGGTEKQLKDWGIGLDFSAVFQNKGKSTATLITTERFDPGATQWPFKQPAIIYRDRVSSGTGGANTFSGGAIFFQGYFDDPKRVVADGKENVHYLLHSIFWFFERNPFKQYRNQFVSFDNTHSRVLNAAVANGGTGGTSAVGDILTAVGGTGTAATFTVVAIDGASKVTIVALANGGGLYTVNPASPNAVTSSGAGTGIQLSLNFGPAVNTVKVVTSEVFLGEQLSAPNNYTGPWPNGNGDQIGEIIDWMNESYNPTRRGATLGIDAMQDVVTKGTIDPHTKMPITRVNTLFCDEAIKSCMRWDPDAVLVEDHSTTPPTLNVRKLAKWNYGTVPPTFTDFTNLPLVTLNITTDQEKQILASGTKSKQLPGVIIYYKSVNQLDSIFSQQIVVDNYPGGITDFTPEVSSHTIDLAGSKLTHVRASVKTTPIAQAISATAGDRKDWWKAHDKSLSDPAVKDSSITATIAAVVDDTGTAIDTTVFTNELLSPLPSWVGARIVRARVSATLSFDRYADGATQVVVDRKTKDRIHTQTVMLTTATPRLYTRVAEFESAEVPPVGVAESVYRSAAADGWAGSITLLDAQLRTIWIDDTTAHRPPIGVRLKLVGPTTTFQNILVQSVSMRPAMGETTVEFGPGPLVDLDLWIELARASRARITYDMPSGRGDGASSGDALVDQTATGQEDNTSHGVGGASRMGAYHVL